MKGALAAHPPRRAVRVRAGPFEYPVPHACQESGSHVGDLPWVIPSRFAPALVEDKAGGLLARPVHAATGSNAVEVLVVRSSPAGSGPMLQIGADEHHQLGAQGR